MTPAPAHVRATCPVCGVDLAFTKVVNPDGSLTIELTPYGTTHVGAHYK